ncbi:MAG: hypothetical protein ACRCZF_23595 [Gemmataceae bacterium]
MTAEISYDFAMRDDMELAEGVYRLPGLDWCVFVTALERDELVPKVVPREWITGITGRVLFFPSSEPINATTIERLLSAEFNVSRWIRVSGPDSFALR